MFISFEETIPDLTQNAGLVGFDLDALPKKLFLDHVHISRSEIAETGEMTSMASSFELPTLSRGSGRGESSWTPLKRSSRDVQTLVSSAPKSAACSTGSSKKDKHPVITAERDPPDKLTRHGIEEFVSDCVIVLDHRIREEMLTQRLRVRQVPGINAWHQRVSVPHR